MGIRVSTAVCDKDDTRFYFLCDSRIDALHPQLYLSQEEAWAAREEGAFLKQTTFPTTAADEEGVELYLEWGFAEEGPPPGVHPDFASRISRRLMCITGPITREAAQEEAEAATERHMRSSGKHLLAALTAKPAGKRRRLFKHRV